ncbi:DUF1003 domain-containing protein [Sphingomonas sp. ID1715]|uniref:DUF1003 domain-containing protein n=1 Tax=Sphingomonas sp. ID1715 TaxID=1656898 RepID=UPI0014880460|nr:DUF1003 domain-containing protein [Sphingomonas sp. ID1715]NNM77718.1 DUF1003 domain-containing protein [Sphingomonas sp. ID1715]
MTNMSSISYLAQRYLKKSGTALEPQELRVLNSIADREPLSRRAYLAAAMETRFWDRLADRVVAIGGSWAFIFGFLAVLIGWMLVNTEILSVWKLAFDPYPYIFLNLMLSMIAALQAPIIMMSQNRQAQRDRLAAQHDYEVNLRAELEIMALHEKWDFASLSDLGAKLDRQLQLIETLLARVPETGR